MASFLIFILNEVFDFKNSLSQPCVEAHDSARQTLPGWLFAFQEEKRQAKHGQKSPRIGFQGQGARADPLCPCTQHC